jgi:phage terminase large subunit
VEEAYELDDEKAFRTLVESIRGVMPEGLWKQFTLTYNPWINSHWTKDRFWDKEDPNADRFTTTHHINEWLDEQDHQTIEELQETDPERYKVVGLGEYGLPGGAYFNEFRRDIHVCEPFVIPDHWHRYFSCDYGLDMFAGLWIARDPQGNAYVYKEGHESELIVSEAAKRYIEINNNDKVKIKYGPPDLWNRRNDTGKSAADIFHANGVTLVKSDNSRINGWLAVKDWLQVIEQRDEQTGLPVKTSRLKIFSNCTNLIRCLPAVQHDEKDPNDVATEPHDLTHIVDALRGWCIMWTTPAKQLEEAKTEHDKYVAKVIGQKKKSRKKLV